MVSPISRAQIAELSDGIDWKRRKRNKSKKTTLPPARAFDAPEFLNDCLSQLAEEQVVVCYITDAQNRVTGFEVVAPGRGVVATVNITPYNE